MLLEPLEDADVRDAARGAAAERQRDLRTRRGRLGEPRRHAQDPRGEQRERHRRTARC